MTNLVSTRPDFSLTVKVAMKILETIKNKILVWRFQAIIIVQHFLLSLKDLLMVLQDDLVTVVFSVCVRACGSGVAQGESAGDEAVAGDDVDGVGGGGGAAATAQVLSQVELPGGEVPRLGAGQALHQGARPRAPRSHSRAAAGRVLAPLVHRAAPGVHEEV